MVSFRVALLVSVAVFSSASAHAQGYYPQESRAQTLGQSFYAPPDSRAPAQLPQVYVPQDFRAAAAAAAAQPIAAAESRTSVSDHRAAVPDPRAQIQAPRSNVPEYRNPVPDFRAQAQDSRAQAPDYRNQLPDYRSQMPDYRGTGTQDPRIAAPRVQPAVSDLRPALPDNRALPTDPPRSTVETRGPVQLIITPQPKPNFIDYKVVDGKPYDYRPMDYKPVDTRAMDYRSEDNKGQDQKILDPRLKEKGPEIQARIDCKAVLYRMAECNFLDYREIDPKLQELFAKFPEISFGIVPKEYTKDAMDRWTPLITHLSKEVGLKITLKVANDYQALIESQKAGLIHVAMYSPMAFARARLSGAKVDAFAIETNPDGAKGSHAMIYSMARGAASPRVDDMKGKSLALVDPNSTSGYNVPRFTIASQKVDPETFLGRQVFTGSHENALMALSQGLVDYAVGQWSSDEDSTLQRLLAKGQLKNVDGTAMRRDDFRVVMKSDLILNAPIAYLSDLPEEVKAMIRRAMLEAPVRDRAAFDRVYEGKGRTWDVTDSKAFDGTIDLLRFMDESRNRVQQSAAMARQTTR